MARMGLHFDEVYDYQEVVFWAFYMMMMIMTIITTMERHINMRDIALSI